MSCLETKKTCLVMFGLVWFGIWLVSWNLYGLKWFTTPSTAFVHLLCVKLMAAHEQCCQFLFPFHLIAFVFTIFDTWEICTFFLEIAKKITLSFIWECEASYWSNFEIFFIHTPQNLHHCIIGKCAMSYFSSPIWCKEMLNMKLFTDMPVSVWAVFFALPL